ncbi:MAG TPA: helix-turn-helix domain-containing protein [Polyangiaceae bacterium]
MQRALGVLDGRWKLAILFRLFATRVLRYSELRHSIEQVTPRMLTLHLRELERDGVVVRTAHPCVPPKVEYALTDKGRALRPILLQLREWI